ncbi:hypothetical protein KJ966_07865 [bacterium]|nr:hypothetical protein [bacterium]
MKPQDILVLLKLVAIGPTSWSYAELSASLGMSSSQLHSAIKRVKIAGLAFEKNKAIVPNIRNLKEFLVHGVKYVFVAERGELTRGIPTRYAASPLKELLIESSSEPLPVWPDPEGEKRGISFSPIYKLAPQAAKKDHALYELLILVDSIRDGRAREKDIASKELIKRLEAYG